jgi:hypothetical protein
LEILEVQLEQERILNAPQDFVPKLDLKKVSGGNTNQTPPTTNRGMEKELDFHKINSSQKKTFQPSPTKNYYKHKCEKLLMEKQKHTVDMRE